jgi:hypothetical protein
MPPLAERLDSGIIVPCDFREPGPPVWLFLITQQFSFGVPDLEAVSVDYVMIGTQ